MTSFVSSILHNSANKIESMSLLGSKHNSNNNSHHKNKTKGKHNNQQQTQQQQQQQQQGNLGSRLAMHASTPILAAASNNTNGYYYHHPQMSYSAEYIPAPPPYDQQQQLQQLQQQLQQQQQQQMQMHSPTPTPSTSWTSEMSALAEKIKDDVTSTFKGGNSSKQQQQQVNTLSNIDRHSISQGMKLVSIAADEYEEGNESVALDIYLTGVDKILMALPNKTDMGTKMAIREKLQSVEERVGILNIATTQKKIQQQQQLDQDSSSALPSSVINSFILLRIASTISTISSKAYQSAIATGSAVVDDGADLVTTSSDNNIAATSTMPTIYIEGGGDSMTKFKRFGQYMIDITVTCAVLIKQSPLPDLVSFLFGYMIQLFLWVDSQYHINQKVQNFGIQCIKFGLQADEQYRLHEFVSEGLYMLIAAGLKAAVAFKETPRYDSPTSRQQQHIRNRSEPPSIAAPSPSPHNGSKTGTRRNSDSSVNTTQPACSPAAPQKTRTSWVWTPW